MSDIDEGVGWRIKADMSDVLAAYDKAEAASKKAADAGAAAAARAGDAMAKAGATAQKTGESWNKAGEAGAKGFTSATAAVDKFIARVNDSQTKLQAMQSRYAALQGQFAHGSGQSGGDLANSLLQAGSLRTFVGAAGGPIGATALAAGFAYGQAQQYSAIGEIAEKARASAREIEGLDRVFAKLGVDAGTANGIIGTFADKLRDTGQAGANFRAQLDGMGISLSNTDGSARSAVAVLGDVAARIKNTADESEKLKIATATVGDQLAGPFLSAINQSKTGLSDLSSAAHEAGSSFTNDLAKGARVAMDAIAELGRQADGVYAQLKSLVGLASNLDKVKAAQQAIVNARLALDRAGTAEPWSPAGVSEHSDAPAVADKAQAERDLLAAQTRLAKLREETGTAEKGIDASRFGYVNGKTVTIGDMQGPEYQEPQTETGGRRRTGSRSSSAGSSKSEEVDQAQQVIDRLQQQLAAARELETAHGSIVEKQRTVAELLRAGVTLESEQGQQVAGLVAQLEAVKKAEQDRVQAMQQVKTLTADVAGGIDQWLVGGQKFGTAMQGMLKQMESQMLRMALIGGNGGGGLFGTLLSGGSGGGGLSEQIAGFFAGKFAAGGEIPAGQFGLVGENGPEIVTGPRQITPMAKVGAATAGPPVVHQYFSVSGAISSHDVQTMVRQGASELLQHLGTVTKRSW